MDGRRALEGRELLLVDEVLLLLLPCLERPLQRGELRRELVHGRRLHHWPPGACLDIQIYIQKYNCCRISTPKNVDLQRLRQGCLLKDILMGDVGEKETAGCIPETFKTQSTSSQREGKRKGPVQGILLLSMLRECEL